MGWNPSYKFRSDFGNEKPARHITLEDTRQMTLYQIMNYTNQFGELDLTQPDPDARYIDVRRMDEKYLQMFKRNNLYFSPVN